MPEQPEQPEQIDFDAWFRSLPDVRQELVLLRLREVAAAILAKHAQNVLTQPPKRNVITYGGRSAISVN